MSFFPHFRLRSGLQQHNRIILRTASWRWRGFADRRKFFDENRLAARYGTEVTIVSGALLTLFAFITIQRLPGLHQGIEQRNQAASALSQFILDAPRQAAIVVSHQQIILLHL